MSPRRPVLGMVPMMMIAQTAVVVAGLQGARSRLAPAGPGSDRAVIAQATVSAGGRTVTLRGMIARIEGARLTVTTAGSEATVTLIEPLTVTGAHAARLADLAPGTFLGTAARAQGDGTFRALEVHIFPESMRGTGEGHRPMDRPDTTMTNANVDAVVARADGPELTLVHKDGTTRVVVPPDTPIVRFEPGDPRLLVPGASIVVFRALQGDDGGLRASRVTVGVNGTRLPL